MRLAKNINLSLESEENILNIEKIQLQRLKMPLKSSFETSFGTTVEKDFIIVRAFGDGKVGFGESVALSYPTYNEETTDTVWYMLQTYLIPALFLKPIETPDDLIGIYQPIKRNKMAKAALEGAIWDLYAKQKEIALATALGGTKDEVEVGVSIGIEKDIPTLLKKVEGVIQQGYRKIKIKIKPGWDIEPIKAIRKEFGNDVPLMADANSAYSLNDAKTLIELDKYNLIMIEQPLAHDDIYDHSKLQPLLSTPICLDESIHSVEDARKAIELQGCKIINIKIGRVGGLSEAKRIHDLCESYRVPVWCGGMLESGVGRAHNIAIASLNNFTIPGDTSVSNRYWEHDIVVPEVKFSRPGYLSVPKQIGIGYEINESSVENYLLKEKEFQAACSKSFTTN